MTDRSEGCSSLKDGEIEIMMQRRLLYDDRRGVDERMFILYYILYILLLFYLKFY